MRLVYLVRDEENAQVRMVFKKPVGVRVSNNLTTWYFRGFSFLVGKADSRLLHSDNWSDPIGVFDLDKPKHLKNLFEMAMVHTKEMLEGRVLAAVGQHLPVEINNKLPPRGPGGTQRTKVGADIVKVFRHGIECGQW